jgi:hypothetical protein
MIAKYEVLYPLFSFDYTGEVDIDRIFIEKYDLQKMPENYIFEQKSFVLKSFNLDLDYPDDDQEFYSTFEKAQMKECKWCISVQENLYDRFENSRYLSLLLMAFRIHFNTNCFVKYKICTIHPEKEIKLHNQFLKTPTIEPVKEIFRIQDMKVVDNDFNNLLTLFNTSYRTRHALEFLYLGFTEYYALASFILYMTSLESFYLPYTWVPIKQTLKSRVNKLINDETIVTEDIIDELYSLRSDIAHGKIETDLNMIEFLPRVSQLQFILLSTIRIIFENNWIEKFATEELKEELFNSLIFNQ